RPDSRACSSRGTPGRRPTGSSTRRMCDRWGSAFTSTSDPGMRIVVHERIPLAPYTTLGLGGPARYFCECVREADVLEALALARSRGLEVQIIGGGSNVVIADAGFSGLVVRRSEEHTSELQSRGH